MLEFMNTDRANQLIAEIQDLTRQYHAEISSKRKPWPKSIKDRVRELFSMDVHHKKTAEIINIPYATVMAWKIRPKKKSKSEFHALTVRPNPTVTVRNSDSQKSSSNLTVTVKTPEGYILELPEAVAAKIILELQRGVGCF
ncbi:MAG: hypothetical protein ACXVCP_07215 [Bdellovibrio sp.]